MIEGNIRLSGAGLAGLLESIMYLRYLCRVRSRANIS